MKLEKVYVYGDIALQKVSKRYALPILSPSHYRLLYLIKRYPLTASQSARYLKRIGYGGKVQNAHACLSEWVSLGVMEKNNQVYSLSPLGRQYLSGIRNYLFNIRM